MVYKVRRRRRRRPAKKAVCAQRGRFMAHADEAQALGLWRHGVGAFLGRLPRDAGRALLERSFGVSACICAAALERLHRAQDERRVLQKCVQRETQVPKCRSAHRAA